MGYKGLKCWKAKTWSFYVGRLCNGNFVEKKVFFVTEEIVCGKGEAKSLMSGAIFISDDLFLFTLTTDF